MNNHVLVVDDSAVVRALHSYVLRAAGYQVSEAENGFAALESLFHTPCDLAIVDVNMPQMDGFTLLREIRGNALTRDLPVIVCTTEREASDRRMGEEAGADRYVTKPTDPDELLSHVRALLNPAAV